MDYTMYVDHLTMVWQLGIPLNNMATGRLARQHQSNYFSVRQEKNENDPRNLNHYNLLQTFNFSFTFVTFSLKNFSLFNIYKNQKKGML